MFCGNLEMSYFGKSPAGFQPHENLMQPRWGGGGHVDYDSQTSQTPSVQIKLRYPSWTLINVRYPLVYVILASQSCGKMTLIIYTTPWWI